MSNLNYLCCGLNLLGRQACVSNTSSRMTSSLTSSVYVKSTGRVASKVSFSVQP